MTAHELVTDLQKQGFQLRLLPGDKLEVRPFSKLPEEWRQELRQRKAEVLSVLQQQSPHSVDYRQHYRKAAEAVQDDCWSLPPDWLLDHPAFYEQIRDLDDKLSAMEREGVGGLAYQTTLNRLMTCVRTARAAYERESKESGWRAIQ